MRERVRLGGRPLARARFLRGVEQLAGHPWPAAGGFRTTFEHLTALAFLAFQEAEVDRAVVEVGLGGSLDATNVLPPGIALLTPISLDHCQVLGNTVGRIAADKAGILKRGGRVYLMPQRPEARRAIEAQCRREGLRPTLTEETVAVQAAHWGPLGTSFLVRGCLDYGEVATGLLGAHQAANVAAAVGVAEAILPASRLRGAVRRGLEGVRVPGRLDPRSFMNQDLLIDGGHNPAAGRVIAKALARHYPDRRVVAVVGMARDKDHRGFLRALSPAVESFHFAGGTGPRAASPERLRERSPGGGAVHQCVEEALDAAWRDRPDLLLVTGSFLVAGEALGQLGFDS